MPQDGFRGLVAAVQGQYDYHRERSEALRLVLGQLTAFSEKDGGVKRRTVREAQSVAEDRPRKRQGRRLTAAQKKAIGVRMRKYWAEKRKAGG